ncbi:NADH pyrophosphatase [Rhodanobacter thiooxydans]|uniref:NAD(+) diphosphatase n=1 Tax=Rhodanobacter thiooxydans TaxID=416169 RepID=A0A154QFP0_9GAMM|nr:NAD(+) diphosphatase [Rhodanobacter thiooxydans]EIL98247.1 Zn-finger containing NTP pyrophosphohydrolase [Rhodanobacter thiooxydans LCS2]KZC22996.1 NADH pyrophosphatase [Rhodanobacter thiooxydans]
MDRAVQPPLNTFAGLSLVLDRVAELRDESAWIVEQARSPLARYLLLDGAGEAFLHRDRDALRWLDANERERWFGDLRASLLGMAYERPHFLLVADDPARMGELEHALDARRMSLRSAGLLLAADEASLFAYAKGLSHWQRETRFCTHCGAPLLLVAAGHRAQCTNAECARLHFPRTDAAVIMLVEHNGACLLGRQAGWPPGRYSTLAGFVEPGEALEDAVRREVAEEAGVIIDQVRYHSSQPWPMPASLMVGFIATAVSRQIRMRDHELEDARWFTPAQIVDGIADGSFLPSTRLSVSYQLLAHWLRQRAGLELDALTAAATPG